MRPSAWWLAATLLVCLTADWWGLSAAQEPAPAPEAPSPSGLTPQEERGKQIYVYGESDGPVPVLAVLGDPGVEVPGGAMPCANCHGRDGKGRPEGGVTPTDLTWQALTKSYGVRHESGREHPPYTPRLLKRAIAMGIDPAGNELHAAMPRYRMSLEDMEALVAYLQKLGQDRDPGLTEDTLRIGTLLSASSLGETVERVLAAYFADVNERGGVYGRKLELVPFRLPADPAERAAAAADFLDREPVFALTGAVVAGADEALTELTRERELPLVGPFTFHPQTDFPINRYVFYLLSGLPTQAEVLVDLARDQAGAAEPVPELLILSAEGEDAAAAAEAARDQAGDDLRVVLESVPAALPPEELPRLAERLAAGAPAMLLALHSAALDPAFLSAADAAGWRPRVYAPGALAGPGLFEAPASFAERIVLAFPTLPADQKRHGVEGYQRLAEARDLPREHLAAQLSTLVSAQLLVEGLKRSGREVSRERLVEELEALYDYDTGLTAASAHGFTAGDTIGPHQRSAVGRVDASHLARG